MRLRLIIMISCPLVKLVGSFLFLNLFCRVLSGIVTHFALYNVADVSNRSLFYPLAFPLFPVVFFSLLLFEIGNWFLECLISIILFFNFGRSLSVLDQQLSILCMVVTIVGGHLLDSLVKLNVFGLLFTPLLE